MGSSICDRRRLALVLAVLLGLSPAALRAQGSDELATKRQAEGKLQQGVDLLKEHHYAEALGRFREAYALVPSPLIQYDIGLAQLGLDDAPEALQSFEDFLSAAPEAPADKRRKAVQYRDDLRNRVTVVTLNADVPGASIDLDGRDVGRVDFPRRFYLTPGRHELVARTGKVTKAVTLSCVAGQPQTFSMALAEPPAAASAPVAPIAAESHRAPMPLAASPDASSRVQPSSLTETRSASPSHASHHPGELWALAAAGAGAVSLGAGLTFGLLASNHADSVTADSQNRRDFVPSDEASGLRDQRLEIVFLSIGTAAVLAGLGIYVFLRHREAAGGAAQAAP